jgi:hypothetical protein
VGWEYRVYRFPKKGWIHKNLPDAEAVLADYGQRGWELVSVSDTDAIAVFKRRAAAGEEASRNIGERLAGELQELTKAIEELNS